MCGPYTSSVGLRRLYAAASAAILFPDVDGVDGDVCEESSFFECHPSGEFPALGGQSLVLVEDILVCFSELSNVRSCILVQLFVFLYVGEHLLDFGWACLESAHLLDLSDAINFLPVPSHVVV